MYTKTEAAFIILKAYRKPLHVREIIRIALEKGMIKTKARTPWITLNSDFINEKKSRTRRGKDLRFCHVGEGVWGLVEWGLKPVERKPKGIRKSKA